MELTDSFLRLCNSQQIYYNSQNFVPVPVPSQAPQPSIAGKSISYNGQPDHATHYPSVNLGSGGIPCIKKPVPIFMLLFNANRQLQVSAEDL